MGKNTGHDIPPPHANFNNESKGAVTTQSGSKPGLEPTVSASSALLLSAGPAAEQATGSSTSHSPSFTPHLMCKRNPAPPAKMPVRPEVSIGENQGTHFEGIHSISIALSGSTALVVAIIIVLWCFLYKKKLTCCKSRDPVVSYQMQPSTSSSHFIPMPTLQPTAVPQPSAIIPMSSFQPTPAPQPTAVDLEAQVSRLSAQLLLHQQMLQRGPHPDAVSVNPPAQRAIENKYPVV